MKIEKLSKVCAALACTMSLSANSATVKDLEYLDVAQLSAKRHSNDINEILKFSGRSHINTVQRVQLKSGLSKVRYQQTYPGIPVYDHSINASRSVMGVLSDAIGKVLYT